MLLSVAAMFAAPPPGPSLSVAATQFEVDRRPTWLPGVSFFDALGPTAPRDADLDALRNAGIRIVRVWAHWHDTIYGSDGSLTPPGRERLRALVDRLSARGMILELVLLRPGELPGQAYASFSSPAARMAGVKAVTSALKSDRNVLFDLYNEHDHPDGPISHSDLRTLRDAVKAIDPDRIVTVSSTEGHLVGANGMLSAEQTKNLQDEAGRGPGQVAVDVIAAHMPRTDDFAAQTGPRVQALRKALDGMRAVLPIYLNEPKRAQPGRPLAAADYAKAATGARSAGAAGWVLHTSAGFDLKATPFLDALTPQERTGLESIGKTPGD